MTAADIKQIGGPAMADKIFEEPRLAELYDLFDTPDRPDLDHYLSMTTEFDAQSIIDIGCGTGNLACRLAIMGKEVLVSIRLLLHLTSQRARITVIGSNGYMEQLMSFPYCRQI